MSSAVSSFENHIESTLSSDQIASLLSADFKFITCPLQDNIFENVVKRSTCSNPASLPNSATIHADLIPSLQETFNRSDSLNSYQKQVLAYLMSYHDAFLPEVNLLSCDELRPLFCLHILNHVLRTRSRIVHHNAKIRNHDVDKDALDLRDQGLTRPKVLILTPLRSLAHKFVNSLVTCLYQSDDRRTIDNFKRFNDEYGSGENDDVDEPATKKSKKPDDFEELFGGNNDDGFRIGISCARKAIKLYTEFYSSDIIVASPLGIRMAIGTEAEKDFDYDFLSSIEILVMERADVFLMQNWSHVLHIMQHLHRQPKSSHDVDYSRVRMWSLNGHSKLYRQTIVSSRIVTPELRSLISEKYCRNFEGQIIFPYCPPDHGTLAQIAFHVPQAFQRFSCKDPTQESDLRFEFFTDKVLTQCSDTSMSRTLIFVSSYFDFVRLRNYFKREDLSFVQICEYAKEKKISRARDLFYHDEKHFLLYTERCHFFRRYKIKGIRNIIFYQLPIYPHFYSELCNMLSTEYRNEDITVTTTALYCQLDSLRLVGIVGRSRANKMFNAEKGIHLMVTAD